MTKVAAVIPTWNRADLLAELLTSLAQQTRPFDEIIVVDNGSTDNSAQIAQTHNATWIELGQNQGFAPAVNRGIEAATSDWIAILNNDVTLDALWLQHLLDSLTCGTGFSLCAFATGKILSTSNPTQIDATFDELARSGCAWRCGSGQPDSPIWNKPRPIRIAPMTAALFRADIFKSVGPLDETFESYLEDVDFGLRASLAGFEGLYVPQAIAHHRGSATLGEWSPDTVRRISRNQVRLIRKHFTSEPRFPILAGQLLWGFLALRHGRGLSYIRGKLEGLWSGPSGKEDFKQQGHPSLSTLLRASEQSIFELQQQTGFDRYWRAYFWLSRP
jgi:GT2 family glycosyltransferase